VTHPMSEDGEEKSADFSGLAQRPSIAEWHAIEGNVFEGNTCIFTHGADGKPGKKEIQRARLAAAAPALLSLVKLFERSLVYYIRKDRSDGDEEGARMKTATLNQVRAALSKAKA
jgi:hypothetical protein